MTARVAFIDEAADRVLVIANPRAGARASEDPVRRLIAELAERGLSAETVGDLAQATSLATRYHQAGQLLAVVAAGGDGTVAEVVNRTPAGVPVAVYPLGTANLLAGYFTIGTDPGRFAEMLLGRATVRLDAGLANGRVFLLMAGCGFDAEVVHRLHRWRAGRRINYWSYARPILDTIRSYEYPSLRVYCDAPAAGPEASGLAGEPLLARWAFAVNLPCYAGGLQMAPQASGTDGLLDVSLFGRGSILHGLRYLGYVMFGRQRVLADYQAARVKRVRIESDKAVPYQLDGDPGGMLPLEIEVLPERLTLLAPVERIRALGLATEEQRGAGAVS